MRIKTSLPISLAFIKEALGYTPSEHERNQKINAICTDTREICENDLFIPLCGERFDGENFVHEALREGAYSLSRTGTVQGTLKIENSLIALQAIAREYKKLLNIKATVAITGSVGKTTVKNLTSRLLSEKYKIHATKGNLNNEIGVPLTVLSAPSNTEILVIECGMNHSGELSKISKCIEPDISVITKIGAAHIGNFGTREKIAKAKLEILDGMKEAFAIVPYGEPLLSSVKNKKTFSCTARQADFYLEVTNKSIEKIIFSFHSDFANFENLSLNCGYAHIPECLGFALSVCKILGMSNAEIHEALSACDVKKNASVVTAGNLILIDDSYNSSPEAVEYAFDTLALYKSNFKSAVLGDMLELGNLTPNLHRKIGRAAARASVRKLYLFGNFSEYIKEGAVSEGMNEADIFTVPNPSYHEEAAEKIISQSCDGEVILFKGSHKLKMRKIIELIRKKISK